MALTLRELYSEMEDRFHLTCLVSSDSMDHVVSWVHLVEDSSMVEFFWGNELLVTSGYSARNGERLNRLVDALDEKCCIGLVINVGKYVSEVPPEVVRHCRELNVPLITMPWDMYMNEFVKACCSRIDQSSHDMDKLARAVIHAILSPNEKGEYYSRLTAYFNNEAGFQLLDVFVDMSDTVRRLGTHVAELRFHTALSHWGFQYLVFPYEERFVLVLNQRDRTVTDEIAQSLVDTYHATYVNQDMRISVGVGEPVGDVTQLSIGYYSARSAARRAQLIHADIVRFRDMGFYKLLYSLPDTNMVRDYYHEVLDPLLEHDKKHGSNYKETLFRYLLHDGSLQAVADDMYTHRNTVNYRMGRIRELLGCQLTTHSECLPYLLAYHIGVMLKELDDYEI